MHIYKREFAESEGTELILPSGTTEQCWAIGFPPEGKITRFILQQSAGSNVGATVNLLDRQVCQAGSGSSASLSAADPMAIELAQIFPEQTLTSGNTLSLRAGLDDGGPWSYRNREGSFSVPVRAVYLFLNIDAGNADGKQFELAIECQMGGELN